ncbi:MFS transporter [Microbacterium sp. Clip185]|uniref:MFS transporter n=1 Tax=Microbacterium sp. Clip185 TaxID=3025663 RepID=UPI0023667C8A|nr:MFS transporter [Microbacterium sp. Clip185]WDG18658.1 MFS transporter [Microbacterium sp. Clip185]
MSTKPIDLPSDVGEHPPRWRDLFAAPHAAAVLVMASGVALYAMNLYFTAALMPSIAADLGGDRYYAWASTAYLIAAVVATMLIGRILAARGSRGSYLIAFLLFALGTAVSAASPVMEVFVAGRAVQGLGAGMLTGLGYATIRSVLPPSLWTRATGLVSAMFGVGTLVGPALGGVFAQLGAWRIALAAVVVVALALILASRRALPAATGEQGERTPLPLLSITALALTAALLSVSSTVTGIAAPVTALAALALLIAFFVIDARNPHGVLPRLAYRRGNPLAWVYLTVAALCAGVTAENFIPLFAQQLAGATPLVAGLVGAAMSLGWTLAQLVSVSAGPIAARWAVRIGPIVLFAGLAAYGLLQTASASGWQLLLGAVALLVSGAGVGMAFPHLSVAAMRSGGDSGEGAKAAAAVSTTQLIAFTLASALAGNLLAWGDGFALASARWLIFGIAAVTLVGIPAAAMALRRRP